MLLLHSLQDPMLGIGVLNVAPKPLSPLPSPSLPACCAVSLSRSCNFREDGDCADVCHSLVVAAMYRFFPVPARHVRSVPMHLRNHDRVSVPRLRKVAATIVDPATRCFNYSLVVSDETHSLTSVLPASSHNLISFPAGAPLLLICKRFLCLT